MISEVFSFARGSVPGQIVIQLTDRCNAHCPQCGMRVTESFPRSKLDLNDVKCIIDHAVTRGVKAISFTGGEPFLYFNELVELIHYAGQAGIEYIRTGTNGFIFKNSQRGDFEDRIYYVAEKLAKTPLRNFWISIDSASPRLHESMRGFPGIVQGIRKALPIFHSYGIYPSANLGINRNMSGDATTPMSACLGLPRSPSDLFFKAAKTAFRRFFRFTVNLGFTIVNACYPMSTNSNESSHDLKAVYRADSKDAIVSFSASEKALMFRALSEVIPEYRSQIRIFSPRCSLNELSLQQVNRDRRSKYPCRGGIDFFYINAQDGDTYPCGYRGAENLGKYWKLQGDKKRRSAYCQQCEWECFRDPSELFGPFAEAVWNPMAFLRNLTSDKQFYRIWISDLLYYWACHYFNGRIPPDMNRLAFFKS